MAGLELDVSSHLTHGLWFAIVIPQLNIIYRWNFKFEIGEF